MACAVSSCRLTEIPRVIGHPVVAVRGAPSPRHGQLLLDLAEARLRRPSQCLCFASVWRMPKASILHRSIQFLGDGQLQFRGGLCNTRSKMGALRAWFLALKLSSKVTSGSSARSLETPKPTPAPQLGSKCGLTSRSEPWAPMPEACAAESRGEKVASMSLRLGDPREPSC